MPDAMKPGVNTKRSMSSNSHRRGLKRQVEVLCAITAALGLACSGSGGVDPGTGSGGSGSAAAGSTGVGGTSNTVTGGAAGASASGGATSGPERGGSGGSGGGSGSTVDASTSGPDSARPSGSGGAGGAAGSGSTPGTSGAAGASGSSGTGGRAGDGGTASTGGGGAAGSAPRMDSGVPPVTGPVTAPVQDTASRVPIIRAPSAAYKVEGNYAYGPETAQRLDVIYPVTAGPKGTQILPMVLMFHGGGWVHSYTNNYGSGKDHMTTFSDRFLAHGFMVCDAEYRVADNTVDGALAPAAVQDALLAAKWCWDHMDYFHGDRTKYVVTGASAGAHLALMVGMGTAESNLGPTNPLDFRIAAIVDGYGIADVAAVLNGLARPWIPATLPNRDAVVKAVNPMTYIRKDIPPMIVVQGENDNTAPVGDSRRMVAALKAVGADATMHEVPGAGHGYTAGAQWDDAEKAMFDWLTAHGIGK